MNFLAKQKHKRCLSTLIVLAMMLTLLSSFAQTVNAATASTTISSSSTYSTVAKSTTTATSKKETTHFGTTSHIYGLATQFIPNTNFYVYASDTIGPPQYTSYFSPHIGQLGLSSSKIVCANKEVYIAPMNSSGTYYLYATWSCQRLVQQVITSYSGGSRIDYARTVAYVPHTSSVVTEITWSR